MVLSTTQKVIERAGIGIQEIDENVGTGDNSETDFDLDYGKVVAGSYTLSYAASGSNDFTALTETTHYTLDKDSGRIVLESAGVTALGTNILYATYTRLDEDSPLNDSIVSRFLTQAGERLREVTGRVWSSTTFTKFFDGYRADTYPRTDEPFSKQRSTWDYIQLDEFPVTAISEIWFLDRDSNTFDAVQVYDASPAGYTDEESDAEDPDTTFYPLNSTPASNDAMYIGLGNMFMGCWTRHHTLGTDAGSLAVTWEYWNGSAWTALSNVTASATNGELFLADSNVYWDWPADWTKVDVNSAGSMYWVRARLSAGSYTNVPLMWEVWPDTDRVISKQVSTRHVQFTAQGRLSFITESVPNGIKNIRVKYTAGVASGDKDYNIGLDLETCYAALQCVVAMTGGSYDDETSFTLGSKAVTVGEVYVNIREVTQQLKDEIKELIAMLGRRMDIAGN